MDDRVKPLEGVRNFRDFGGYEGVDGARIKSGKLYRSGHFGEASDNDLAAIDLFNITLQADLRRPDERERHGDKRRIAEVALERNGPSWSPERTVLVTVTLALLLDEPCGAGLESGVDTGTELCIDAVHRGRVARFLVIA